MIEFFYIITAFFAVIGICEFVLQIAKMFWLKEKGENKKIVLFINEKNKERTEFLIKSTLENSEKSKIYLINEAEEEESQKICEILSKEIACIEYIKDVEKINEIKKCFT